MLQKPSFRSHRVVICPFASVACSLALLGCGGSPAAAGASPPTLEPDLRAPSPLAQAATALAGTWHCRGSVHGPDGPAPSEVILDFRRDVELDEAWLQAVFAVSSGKYDYRFTSYRTFDTASSTWVNVIVDNLGGHTVSRSTDGVVWTGESSGPMGGMKIRDTEARVSAFELNLLGQYSVDGKRWKTGYDLSCAK